MCHPLGLECRRGLGQPVLDLIEGKTAKFKFGGRTWRHRVKAVRRFTKRRNRFILPRQVVQLAVCTLHRRVGQAFALLAGSSNPEEHDLLVEHALWRGEPINRLLLEMRGKHRSAPVNAIMGNHHHQDATWFHPTETVFQEDRLHPLVPTLPYFEVIWRIEKKEGKGLDRGVAVESASVDDLLQPRSGFASSKGIKFDAVAAKNGVRPYRCQSSTGSGARIK